MTLPRIYAPIHRIGWATWTLFAAVQLALITAWAALLTLGWLTLQAKRHPDTAAALTGTTALWWLWTTHPATYPASGAVLAVTFLWSTCWPRSFDTCIGNRARARWRRFLYRHRWARACATAGLSQPSPDGLLPPILGRVRSPSPTVDVIRARLNPRQTPETWQQQAHHLARGLAVHTVRVRPHGRDRVELWAYRRDALAEPVAPLEPVTDVQQLAAVPVGLREDGQVFTLPALYAHTLIAGETGAGKGSVAWSLICGLAPLVHTGHVKLWVIDPKMVEMAAGAPLFDEFVYGRAHGDAPWQTEMAEMLEDAVTGMRQRAERLRGTTRKHIPTPEAPLIVIVVDEIASLTAYVTDSRLRARITDALSLLLSQGRALGISVVMATQDARKEVLTVRDLVPIRVALRAAEATQADMVLGRGARDRGALTDHISAATPGVGYVSIDGHPDPVRVRFSYWDDDAIADVVARYAPPARTETPA